MTSVVIGLSAPGPLGFLGAGALAQHYASITPSLLLVALSSTTGGLITVVGLRVKAQ